MDVFIFVIFVAGAVLGFWKGFIKQLASIVGLVAGLLLARMLFGVVGEKLAADMGTSVTFSQIVAFILIWLVVPIGLSIGASLITHLLNATPLGFFNRWMGAGLGAVKYLLLLSMFFNFVDYIDQESQLIKTETQERSVLYKPLKGFSGVFLPEIKKVTNHLIH